jgi:hypothetical protein
MRGAISILIPFAASIAVVVLLFFGVMLLATSMRYGNCTKSVTAETARMTVQSYLQEPRAESILGNRTPKVAEIVEIMQPKTDRNRVTKQFRFRLESSAHNNWGTVALDSCGDFLITGNF